MGQHGGRTVLLFVMLGAYLVGSALAAAPSPPLAVPAPSSRESPSPSRDRSDVPAMTMSGDRMEYDRDTEVFFLQGSVVIDKGSLRLTADRVTLNQLTGKIHAKGKVHLHEPDRDIWAEELELNLNIEAGVVVQGELYDRVTNALITGRLFQRFSETHYRAKEGSLTTCDAREGQIPAWRFKFEDIDVKLGESVYGKGVWFCIHDTPVIPVPTLRYPLIKRKTGFLFPTIGYDTRFGFHLRQAFFWVIDASQDMTLTPSILTNRGYGGDLEYRYAFSRETKGEWLVSYIQDTVVKRARAQLIGYHTQEVNPNLSIRSKINLLTDRTILSDLSNSGVLRALPSRESNVNVDQRLTGGKAYFLAQYFQPLSTGGAQTFQRVPEVGYRLLDAAPFGSPFRVGLDTTAVNYTREQGFSLDRVDLVPALSTEMFSFGHAVGIKPHLKMREVYYTRQVAANKSTQRGTFWAALEGTSRLVRQFELPGNRTLLHTIEPHVIYEYVPPTKQEQIVQIDAVDNLPKKNLLTYSFKSRLLEYGNGGQPLNRVNLLVAQSYHVGAAQDKAREFVVATSPLANPQPLQLQTVPIIGNKFSDIWTRVEFGRAIGTGRNPNELQLMVDSFFDPYGGSFSQFNTDLRYQDGKRWYLELGQRWARNGTRVKRGDIWNAISFNEVFVPTANVNFLTAGGAIRAPFGITLGGRSYFDIANSVIRELDMGALYQNPCKCWSAGISYLKFPNRSQFNFLISLTGVGSTGGYAMQLLRSLLGPLLVGERGVPW